METSTIAAYRSKWNARYQETTHVPEPHPLAARVRHRFTGGPMLDAACGLGRGVALAAEHFAPLYAMDISDVAVARAKAR